METPTIAVTPRPCIDCGQPINLTCTSDALLRSVMDYDYLCASCAVAAAPFLRADGSELWSAFRPHVHIQDTLATGLPVVRP